MTTDIFIRTYEKDIPWFNYCLKSIAKFATGFRKVIVCIPEGQQHLLSHLTSEKVVTCPVYKNDYNGQQITKLSAWTYTDADYILFIDSDCIFNEDVCPEDYIIDGKPILIKENFERLKENEGCYARKKTLSELFGFDVEFEYMRRNGLFYRRDTLKNLFIRLPITEDNVISEFNVIGIYCDKYEHDKYTILEAGVDKIPDNKVRQFWSWGGLSDDIKSELEYSTETILDIKNRNDVGKLLDTMNCKVGVEIGVQDGENARNILRSGIEKLYLVDLWETQKKEDYIDGSRDIDFDVAYKRSMELAKEDKRVTIMKTSSDEASKVFEPGSFDFIYLDANHHNPQFERDLENWYPLLKSGGLFGGHDYYDCNYEWYKCEVRTIVNRFARKNNLKVQLTRMSGDESWWCIKP